MALREFQEKKMARKIFFSWPVLIVLSALSLWMIYGATSAMVMLQKISKKNEELEFKLSETQKSQKTLEEKTKALETEHGVDLEARKNFNLKKPGEEVILFIEE